MIFLIGVLAVFFAMNMGGANFAASFAAPYGGKMISRGRAQLLFTVFVILGAVSLGDNVSVTLGKHIVPAAFVTEKAMAVIFLTAGLSMFISNLMHIPQSTSLVTVAAIAGVGTYFKHISVKTILYMLPFWIFLPVLSYFLTHSITGYIYPPRKRNFWIYERFINHQDKLVKFVIVASCYNAFAVGTNNVANVVGPIIASGKLTFAPVLFVFACMFGVGAGVFSGPIKMAGEKIVPLGLLTASVISFISGSLMIIASVLGIPQSFVMLKMGAIFAISSLKDGHQTTFANPLTRKTLYSWTINPALTFFLSWGLSFLIIK